MSLFVLRALALLICASAFLSATLIPVEAQSAPCGVVDAVDYPIDISDTLTNRYDDFALFRNRFGGRHTGIDVAFNRRGEPVRAAARGEVTYSDPEGWDTEKGVVIVRHSFPDGSSAYTLYGHMEQTDTLFFPPVGTCVERGDVVGVVGWPSRGLPHLHYEIRNFLPDDGGPGYVVDNPLLEGWYHPLDFTEMWRLRLAPGYLDVVMFSDVPSLPPVLMEDGSSIIANADAIEAFSAQGTLLWRVTTEGVITGIIGLPDNRVVAHSRAGQALTLRNGRFAAVWEVTGPDAPIVALGETVIFVTDGGGLAGYTPMGEELWSLPGADATIGVIDLSVSADQVALALRVPGGVRWQVVGGDGVAIYETTFDRTPLIAPVLSGGWLALDGTSLYRIADGEQRLLTAVSPAPGRAARMTADLVGNAYIYLADTQSTLISVSATGVPRWRTVYPVAPSSLAPVLRTDNGCLLYALDDDGLLNVFNASAGDLLTQRQIYAGGIQNGSPRARFLQPQPDDRILIGAGFLSAVLFDGAALGGDALESCLLG